MIFLFKVYEIWVKVFEKVGGGWVVYKGMGLGDGIK